MLHPSLRHWLSLRIRLVCILTFVIGALLPPYIPKEALAQSGADVPTTDSPDYLLVEDGFLMKSSSLTEQGSRRAYAQGLLYTVTNNDSLEKIATKYHISADTIRWANNLADDAQLKSGQQLIILPVDGVLHTVTRGQTLNRIAELYNVPAADIASQNNIDGGFILAGQELIVPGGKPIVAKPAQIAENPSKPGVPVPARPSPPSPGRPGASAPDTPGILHMPCEKCSFTQYFSPSHYAVDIQEKGGGPVFAAEAGTVIRADYGWNGGYGNVIEIDHGNGLVTLYGHSKELYVKKGDHVTRGQNISAMGNTGRVYGVTGIHVHFEVRVNGEKKNPLLYLK